MNNLQNTSYFKSGLTVGVKVMEETHLKYIQFHIKNDLALS